MARRDRGLPNRVLAFAAARICWRPDDLRHVLRLDWARRSASAIATLPELMAGGWPARRCNAPTGVRAALAMTISVIKDLLTGVKANVVQPIAM